MRKLIFGILSLCLFTLAAQDEPRVLTLEECIDMAVNRNLTVKRSQNNLIGAQSNKKQAGYNFLPNVNASVDYNYIDGSFFDNNSGQIVSQAETSTPGVGSNLVVFNAFANHHLLNRRKQEYEASLNAMENTKITIIAATTRNYLTVLLDKENLKISNQRLELLQQQMERERKRVSVGVGSPETVYNFQSQVSNEKLNNVNLTNTYRRDLLTLLQSIQFSEPIGGDIQIEDLTLEDFDFLFKINSFDDVLDEIYAYSFRLKSATESRAASNSFLSQTRSSRYPTISASGAIGSQYSTVNVGDYLTQIDERRSWRLGATLSIPIFNRFNIQNQIDQAKVSVLNAEIDYSQALLDVTNAAQSDYLDLIAAQTQYQSALENFDAQKSTFEFIKKRFETGNTDFYTYQESLNSKNAAEAQLANAKYTIVFRKKILDLYRGK